MTGGKFQFCIPDWMRRDRALFLSALLPIPALPGHPAKHDHEYKRCGMCNIFLAFEPLAGKRMVNNITKRKTRRDWAFFLEKIANQYEREEKIALVMDNLSTHCNSSYLTFFYYVFNSLSPIE
jgi:hypothetical protein